MPVKNSRGQAIGVASISINADRIGSVLSENSALGATGETYLVNLTTGKMLSQSRHIEENTILNHVVDTLPVNQARENVKDGVHEYQNYLGVPVIGAWHLFDDSTWLLIGEITQEEAYMAMNSIATIVVLVVVVAAIAIILFAFLIARTFSRPVMNLTQSAMRIAAGDLSERA